MSLGDVTKRAASTEPTTKSTAKGERTNLGALNQEVASIVAQFARAEKALKDAKADREAAKVRAMAVFEEHGLQDLDGPEGRVQVIVALGSRRLDMKKVRALLTKDQVEDCTSTGKTQTKVKFVATKGAGPTEVK